MFCLYLFQCVFLLSRVVLAASVALSPSLIKGNMLAWAVIQLLSRAKSTMKSVEWINSPSHLRRPHRIFWPYYRPTDSNDDKEYTNSQHHSPFTNYILYQMRQRINESDTFNLFDTLLNTTTESLLCILFLRPSLSSNFLLNLHEFSTHEKGLSHRESSQEMKRFRLDIALYFYRVELYNIRGDSKNIPSPEYSFSLKHRTFVFLLFFLSDEKFLFTVSECKIEMMASYILDLLDWFA